MDGLTKAEEIAKEFYDAGFKAGGEALRWQYNVLLKENFSFQKELKELKIENRKLRGILKNELLDDGD